MRVAVLRLVAFLMAVSLMSAQLEDVRVLLARMKEANTSIVDMKCLFSFKVTKDGREFPTRQAVLRLRSNPETIHMTFVDPAFKGRLILYVKGKNQGKMKVRPNGFWKFLTVSIDPQGEQAMKDALDPVTALGFPNIVRTAEEMVERVGTCADGRVSVEWNAVCERGVYIRMRLIATELGEVTMLVDPATFFPFQILKKIGNDAAVYTYEEILINPGLKDSEFTLSVKR